MRDNITRFEYRIVCTGSLRAVRRPSFDSLREWHFNRVGWVLYYFFRIICGGEIITRMNWKKKTYRKTENVAHPETSTSTAICGTDSIHIEESNALDPRFD